MDCAEFREALVGDPSFRLRIESVLHMRHCAACCGAARDTDALARALREVPQHQPPPGLRERLVALASEAGQEAGPVAGAGRRSWVRWAAPVVAALVVAALLLGVRDRPPTALTHALAEIENAKTMHEVIRYWGPRAGDWERCEVWIAEGGMRRQEMSLCRRGTVGRGIGIDNGRRHWAYNVTRNSVEVTEGGLNGSGVSAHLGESPLHASQALARATRGRIRCRGESNEGGRRVITYTMAFSWDNLPGRPRTGDTSVDTFVLDAETKRLVRHEIRMGHPNRPELTVRADPIEYNIPIPRERFSFVAPPGARVVVHDWWRQREDQLLATATRHGWKLKAHAVDVRPDGDVILSVSLDQPPATGRRREQQVAVKPAGRLFDDRGRLYARLKRGPRLVIQNGRRVTMFTDSETYMDWSSHQSTVYWALDFTPVQPPVTGPKPRSFRPELRIVDAEGKTVPGLEKTLTFGPLPAGYLPPGDPFARDARGKPLPEEKASPEEDARDRKSALEAYHAQYGP